MTDIDEDNFFVLIDNSGTLREDLKMEDPELLGQIKGYRDEGYTVMVSGYCVLVVYLNVYITWLSFYVWSLFKETCNSKFNIYQLTLMSAKI